LLFYSNAVINEISHEIRRVAIFREDSLHVKGVLGTKNDHRW
jgi:hypothetical protein